VIIKNRDELDTTGLRKQALDIIEAGIARVLPAAIMKSSVRYDPSGNILTVNYDEYPIASGRIFVIGGGKASGQMAEMLESIISPENITAGVVTCNSSNEKTKRIETIEAGHPVPDRRGAAGVEKILALKDSYSISKGDLVICLISGGGSALMPCPAESIKLEDKQTVTDLLLASGADIHEINSVRKHLSKTKGGGLGNFFSPATVVSLIISDVTGNDLDVIASGPTSPDPSTFSDALNVLEKYDLVSRAPESVVTRLRKGTRGKVPETPKSLENCRNYIIGDNRLALEAMAEKAAETGLTPYIVTDGQKGDTAAAAELRAVEILDGKYSGYNAVLIGGETTPTLPDIHGKGGRNQHYAAVSMQAMSEYPGEWTLASAGTDGSDFLPDVAGAIVDNNTLDSARNKGIDVEEYTARYDSNTLFEKIGGSLIVTGSTGTNVGDIIVYILSRKQR